MAFSSDRHRSRQAAKPDPFASLSGEQARRRFWLFELFMAPFQDQDDRAGRRTASKPTQAVDANGARVSKAWNGNGVAAGSNAPMTWNGNGAAGDLTGMAGRPAAQYPVTAMPAAGGGIGAGAKVAVGGAPVAAAAPRFAETSAAGTLFTSAERRSAGR